MNTPIRKASSQSIEDEDITPLLTPLRRRSAIRHSECLEAQNDETERSERRSMLDMKRQIASIPSTPKANINPSAEQGTVLNDVGMKEHYDLCTKLFNTNKITTKNVWELHIIDVLQYLTRNSGRDLLQVAGTSLDIAAKIYGVRVDDIYTKGMQLARQLSRAAASRPTETEGTDTGTAQDTENVDPNAASAKPKKGAKKVRRPRNRSTLANLEDITAPIPKLESVFFAPAVHLDVGVIGNLFTNTVPKNASHTKFNLFSNEKPIVTANTIDKVIEPSTSKETGPKKYKLGLKNLKPAKLCPAMSNFVLDEWDPELEERELSKQNAIQDEVLFDQDGLPIHELDGSIPDLCVHDDDGDGGIFDLDPDQKLQLQLRGGIENIRDFVPTSNAAAMPDNVYSYNSILQTPSGKYIDQIWAGPSHWKFKHIRPVLVQSSCTLRPPVKKGGRKKRVIMPVDYKAGLEATDDEEEEEELVLKRKVHTVDAKKLTLPWPEFSSEERKNELRELQSRPGTYPVPRPHQPDSASSMKIVEIDVPEYDYQNPNDSNYCPQAVNDDNDHLGSVDGEEEIVAVAAEQFVGDNLVEAPPMVNKPVISFAMHAKKMNMKKLKSACWEHLAKGADVMEKESTFSEMYRELQSNLPDKMKEQLSPHLAFVALLHNANDHNLKLEQEDITDFKIKQGNSE